MKINKIHIFLIVLIFVMGGYLFYNQFFKNEPIYIDDVPSVSSNDVENNTNGSDTESVVNPFDSQPLNVTITQEELSKQIKNKQYLEDTYMALEYSKVNNVELRKSIEAYLDDNSTMKPEDIAKLIELHEKTFLNRYLKVYVDAPSAELNDLNAKMRRLFYQIKLGFDTLHAFGQVPLQVPSAEGEKTTSSIEQEPNYNPEILRQGLQQLVATDELVNQALKQLGEEDIKIERKWIEANISETDIVNAIDSSNTDILPNMNN